MPFDLTAIARDRRIGAVPGFCKGATTSRSRAGRIGLLRRMMRRHSFGRAAQLT